MGEGPAAASVEGRRFSLSRSGNPFRVRTAWLFLILALAILAAPLVAEAQQAGKVYRIGILPAGPISTRPHLWEAFRQALLELGYVEGKNLVLELPSVDVRPETLGDIAAELVRRRVNVIVTASAPASVAAKRATSSIPIVIAAIGDPVAVGLVASLARPGGNVTGLSLLHVEVSAKRVELLRALAPHATRLAILYNPTNPTTPAMTETQTGAQALGFQLQMLPMRDAQELETVFSALSKDRPDALIVMDDPVIYTLRRRIAELAARTRVPAMYALRDYVDEGALMSYGPSIVAMYRRAAVYVDKILKGARPADLPVEQPTKFELVINLKTAKALGLTIPQSVLMRADEVIQ